MTSSLFTRLFAVTFSVLLLTSTVAFGGIIGAAVADHNQPGTSATVSVTPSVPKGIDATDFDTGSYVVTNTGSTNIVSVSFDLQGAMLPDSVFDPAGSNVGDTAGKCFTADSGAAATGLLTDGSKTTAPCLDPFSGLHNGDIDQGYDVLTIEFSDFEPGETFTFSADIDPTSITGSVPPGPADSSSVSGLELTGAVVSVTGSDGQTVSNTLFADGSDSGAATITLASPAPAPSIAVQGVTLDATTLSPAHRAAETAAFDHTVVVSDVPAGATVRLLGTELGLYTDGVPSDGFDIERYEANRLLSQSVATAVADATGTATFDVTLADTVAEGGFNYFVAAYDDGAGHTSDTSEVVVLQYDENAGVNDAPAIDPISPRLVQSGSTLDVSVRATDADFDPITLSVSGLPDFGTFTDDGDGTGLLSLTPTAADVGVYTVIVAATDGSATTTEPVSVTVTEAKTGIVAYRVNAGGASITPGDSPVWESDSGSTSPYRNSGSATSFWGGTVSSTTTAVPAGTPSGIWQSARYDPISGFAGADDPEMEWAFDVAAGTLTEVRLYFAEGFAGASQPGQRVFDVSIDGNLALDNYDIVADVGYATGTTKTFTVVSDGTVDIDFGHEFQNPVVSAIEIITFEADPGEIGAVPTSVDFGTVVADSTATATVTLTNLGQPDDPDVTLSGASVTGTDAAQFDATITGPATVAPGESTTVEVSFTPTGEGSRLGTLVVNHDGSNDPVTVALVGTASAASPVGFTPAGVPVSVNNPTSLQWGPDGRLYVAEQMGRILALDIQRNGPAQYEVIGTEVITAVQAIPNHDDDGTPNTALTTRQVTGILLAGTASQPILYVTSSDPRIGGQSSGTDLNLDTNSGVLSRLTKTPTGWNHVQLVRGLPRSEENHAPNGMALDQSTNTLYLAQGGNTGQGAPSQQLAYLSEFAYAGAILDIDLAAIDALPTVDGVKYDLPTLQNTAEPFGGQDGLNQAIITAASPVQVFSPGYRNPYDIVLTESGRLYTADNGGSGGWGDVPVGEGPAGVCTNAPNDGGTDKIDQFHLVTEGFYAGHPNPTRANPDGAGVYAPDGTLLLDFTAENTPVPFDMANPVECDARDPPEDGSLTTFADSTNGLTEYTASNFGGAMQGDILAASFTTGGPIWRLSFNDAGDQIVQKEGLLSNFGSLPLDVTAVGDDGVYPGTVWAVAYGANSLIVFEPDDYDGGTVVCTGADDPTLDEDNDGYSNADEIAAGTNPCSAGSKPADADGDGISDLTDTDDDNDSIPDTTDAFAIDPANGLGTTLPVVFDFEAGGQPNTLFDMGFTGLMTDGSDYLDRFEADRVAAGGIAGVFTVPATEGTALGPTNTQAYAFQFGFDPDEPFVASTVLESPFPASDAPVPGQAAGLFVGTGSQDDYLALLVTGDDGASGPGRVELRREVGGTAETVAVVDAPEVVGNDRLIDLRLSVDPATGAVTASYVINDGSEVEVGSTTVPLAWVDGTAGTAVGIVATSAGPAGEFAATYDELRVVSSVPVPVTAPVLATIGDPVLTEGETLAVGISATDTDGESITLSATDLPAFATFTDDGDGTGTLTLAPTVGDAGIYRLTVTASDGTRADSEAIAVTVRQSTDDAVLYRLNAGGPSLSDSPDWIGDDSPDRTTGTVYRSAGSAPSTAASSVTTVTDGVPAGTPLAVTQSARWDPADGNEMAYGFDVPAGTEIEVRLYFVDAYSGTSQPGQRVFDVRIDGDLVLNDYDIVADAGFEVGTMRSFRRTSDGTVDIAFGHVVENPIVAGIEIIERDTTPTNAPPVLAPIGDPTLTEGEIRTVGIGATDADGDLITLTASDLPTFGTFIDDSDGTGTLALGPGVGDAGTYRVTVTASDGQATDTETLTVLVRPADATNDAPVLWTIGDPVVEAGTTATVPLRVSDAEGDTITLTASGLPAFATLVDNGNRTGGLTFATAAEDAGSYRLTVTASDGELTDSETIILSVRSTDPNNQAPSIAAVDDTSVEAGQTQAFRVSATDPDTTALTLSAAALPDFATFTDNGDGTGVLTVSPDSADAGSATLTLSASDGTTSDTQAVTLTVVETAPSGVYHRVNVGGSVLSATDDGPDWISDDSTDRSSGTAYRTAGSAPSTAAGSVTARTDAVPAGTPLAVTQSARWDPSGGQEMAYRFDVPAGTEIEVRLYFVDAYSGTDQPGQRVFDVRVDGTLALNDYDIVADAGFEVGTMRSLRLTSDGTVDIRFEHVVENPILAGIEILDASGDPVSQAPTAAASATPSVTLVGTPVAFDARASVDIDGAITTYGWDFDSDGLVDATGETVSHAFDTAGQKQVTLTVVDDEGLTDTATVTVTVADTTTDTVLYRVNAGGPALSAVDSGPDWTGDASTDRTTGTAYRNAGSTPSTAAGSVSAVTGAVPVGTPLAVVQSARWDQAGGTEMEWAFDVPAGTETEVRLYFVDAYSGTDQPGQRVFDVRIDGTLALNDYDIVADAGFEVGTMRAVTVTSDGTVDIRFEHVVENPILAGIELVSTGQ